MTDPAGIAVALADRYRIERELGAGGMDARADVHAPGYVLYEMLTIVPPTAANDGYAGWSADGRIVSSAKGIESTLWRFRPIPTVGRNP